jgi:predicted AAA+ superfamily ATPase
MEDTLIRILLENVKTIRSRSIIHRSFHLPVTDNINILTGIRRAGKTFLLYQKSLEYNPENVLFIDFEDERLVQLNTFDNYDIIIDSFKRIYPDQKPVLFFDEIQSLKNWHLYLKRLQSSGYRIFVTGSNANLLSKEIATFLAGRSVETSIFPFSYGEYLQLKEISYSQSDYFTSVPRILNTFDDYLIYGGFPEVIKAHEKDKMHVMHTIHELLLYKDLVAKYDKNDYLFQLIVSKLVENIGKSFSVTKLADRIIPVYKTSKPTVIDYVNLLSMPFIVYPVFQFKRSFVQREMERKVYFQDNSFITRNTVEPDKSRLLENCVFNHLNRNFDEVFYYRTSGSLEVDFLVRKGSHYQAIQVCYSLNPGETRQREIKALKKCADELGLKKGLILTYNMEGHEKVNNLEIEIVPVWKFLLAMGKR